MNRQRTTLLFPNTKCSKNLTPASGFAALISANIAISSFTWDWDGAWVRLPAAFGAGGGGAWDVRSYTYMYTYMCIRVHWLGQVRTKLNETSGAEGMQLQ